MRSINEGYGEYHGGCGGVGKEQDYTLFYVPGGHADCHGIVAIVRATSLTEGVVISGSYCFETAFRKDHQMLEQPTTLAEKCGPHEKVKLPIGFCWYCASRIWGNKTAVIPGQLVPA